MRGHEFGSAVQLRKLLKRIMFIAAKNCCLKCTNMHKYKTTSCNEAKPVRKKTNAKFQ